MTREVPWFWYILPKYLYQLGNHAVWGFVVYFTASHTLHLILWSQMETESNYKSRSKYEWWVSFLRGIKIVFQGNYLRRGHDRFFRQSKCNLLKQEVEWLLPLPKKIPQNLGVQGPRFTRIFCMSQCQFSGSLFFLSNDLTLAEDILKTWNSICMIMQDEPVDLVFRDLSTTGREELKVSLREGI